MSEAAPISREEWAADFLDAKGDLIPAPENGSLPGQRVRFTEIQAFRRAAALYGRGGVGDTLVQICRRGLARRVAPQRGKGGWHAVR